MSEKKINHGLGKRKWKECGKCGVSVKDLRRHKDKFHKMKYVALICPFCNFAMDIKNAGLFRSHLRRHGEEMMEAGRYKKAVPTGFVVPASCGQCDYQCIGKDLFLKHQELCHAPMSILTPLPTAAEQSPVPLPALKLLTIATEQPSPMSYADAELFSPPPPVLNLADDWIDLASQPKPFVSGGKTYKLVDKKPEAANALHDALWDSV